MDDISSRPRVAKAHDDFLVAERAGDVAGMVEADQRMGQAILEETLRDLRGNP